MVYRFHPITTNVRDKFPDLARYVEGSDDIVAAYLFGSYAQGKEDALSDVDIALLVRDEVLKRDWRWGVEVHFMGEVEDILGTDEVDVVILNKVPLSFRFEIISTGNLLASSDEEARTDFEVRTMQEYWDYRRIEEEYDRHFLERIKRGFGDVERQEYNRAFGAARRMRDAIERTRPEVAGGVSE
ncbi:MAG: type VII toxin-antitoxin system MntA family adenylyltransferase antitoxin [bacterium]